MDEENTLFCPNCGTKLNSEASFCPNCGHNLASCHPNTQSSNPESSNNTTTFADQLAKNNPIGPFLKQCKDFILKYKIVFGIAAAACLVIIIGLTIFNCVYDFTQIAWDEESGDTHVSMTSADTLRLNVVASGKDNQPIADIEFTTDDGELETNGSEVIWHLPSQSGEYTITATAPSGKSIAKQVEVVTLNNDELAGLVEDDIDDTVADNDNDGLTNAEEISHGTDPDSADTDGDGLSDSYELNVGKTDPLKKDTDDDGLSDGDELDLGLDPLKPDSYGDGIKDSERTLNYTVQDSKTGITLTISGQGNIASTTIDLIDNPAFANKAGLLSQVYNFYTKGDISEATVTIPYNSADLKDKQIDEDNLTIYYFDDTSKALVAVPTTVDSGQHTLTAQLTHFSKYLLGDKNLVQTDSTTDVMFVIDNSISMYSETQMIAAGHPNATGTAGNDTGFKRLLLTNDMVNKLTGNYRFGVAEFAGTYANLQPFTSNRENFQSALNGMRSHWSVNLDGTNLAEALTKAIAEFTEDNNRYIVLLTDGKDTFNTLSSRQSRIISSAQAANVKICIIGLGQNIDTEVLTNIAEETGCQYYNASNAAALDDFYNLVSANIDYGYIDTTNDGAADGMITYDSGFITNRDGFSFENFSSNKSSNGHCYGMATFAMLYYLDQLPLTLPAKDNSKFYLSSMKRVDFAANGYNLGGTFFDGDHDLYDFQFTTPGLDIIMGDLPADYRDRVENDAWMIKTDYYNQLQKVGAIISTKDYKGSDKDFSHYQSAQLQINNSTLTENSTADESSLLDAIWRLFILQAKDDYVGFSSDPDKAYELLTEKLSSGIPVVIGVNRNHAINAVRLIQDNEDANKFKLEVYDNNYPGETRYIEVARTKYSKIQLNYTAWTNEYNYTFYYEIGNELQKIPVQVFLTTVE